MIQIADYQEVLDEIKPNSMKFSNGFIVALVEVEAINRSTVLYIPIKLLVSKGDCYE